MVRRITRICLIVFVALLWVASLGLAYAISDLRGAHETNGIVNSTCNFILKRYHEELKEHTWMVDRIEGDNFILKSAGWTMKFRFNGYKARPCKVGDLPFTGSWLILPSAVITEDGEPVIVGEALVRGIELDRELELSGILIPINPVHILKAP